MLRVATHEAKTQLSRLISKVLEGEEVIICRGGQPAAKLVPIRPGASLSKRPSVGTRTTDRVMVTPDAFAPLTQDELAEWGV